MGIINKTIIIIFVTLFTFVTLQYLSLLYCIYTVDPLFKGLTLLMIWGLLPLILLISRKYSIIGIMKAIGRSGWNHFKNA